MSITPNSIYNMYYTECAANYTPVVQIVSIKNIGATAENSAERYRLVMSDGTHYTQAMMGTQLNSLIESNTLTLNCLVQVQQHIRNVVNDRNILIVLNMTVVGYPSEKIGTPSNVAQAAPAAAPGAPVQQHHLQQQQAYHQPPPLSRPAAAPQQTPMLQHQPPPPPQAPMVNRGPVGRVDPPSTVFPIQALNPYQNKWTIKARVTKRSDVRSWNKSSGSGTLFSADLLDDKGGEIRATFFKEAVDRFFEQLAPGTVHYFSGGKLKVANKKFTSLKNDYEVTFDQNSIIIPCPDDGGIAQVQYNFVRIADLENLAANTDVDVVGVVRAAGECAELTSKAGKQFKKRDLTLVDDSGVEVKLTLWGDLATTPDYQFQNSPVLAVKGCRVSEFGGRSLSTSFSAQLQFNPAQLADAQRLRHWFDTVGSSGGARSLTSAVGGGDGGGMGAFEDRATFADIKDKGLGYGVKPDYVTVKGTITMVKSEKAWYTACPSENCNKKVSQDVAGNWSCERCQNSFPNKQNRYILTFTAGDDTGNSFITAFDDQAKILMRGMTANEAEELQGQDELRFKAAFEEATFKTYLFRLRIKAEDMQDGEKRVKSSVAALQPVNYGSESKSLLRAIAAYN